MAYETTPIPPLETQEQQWAFLQANGWSWDGFLGGWVHKDAPHSDRDRNEALVRAIKQLLGVKRGIL